MRPASSTSPASILASASTGSGMGPPHMPEWTLCRSARTSTSAMTSPRSAMVTEGTPVSKLPVSVSTIASASSRERYLRRKAERCSEPISSSPSMRMRTFTGSSPAARTQLSTAAAWTRMPDLSSALPRPYSRPSRSTGSKGGDFHASSSPGGWTSWWA